MPINTSEKYRLINPMTHGYLDGLHGIDPDEKMSYSGGEYEQGWLRGSADREAGVKAPKYLGFHYDDDLTIKPGMTVTIRKGTMVECRGEVKPAGRTYKVVVNHILNGQNLYIEGSAFRTTVTPIKAPTVRWAGTGGYWSAVDINDIPEALNE